MSTNKKNTKYQQNELQLARFIQAEKRRLEGPGPRFPGKEDTVTAAVLRDATPGSCPQEKHVRPDDGTLAQATLVAYSDPSQRVGEDSEGQTSVHLANPTTFVFKEVLPPAPKLEDAGSNQAGGVQGSLPIQNSESRPEHGHVTAPALSVQSNDQATGNPSKQAAALKSSSQEPTLTYLPSTSTRKAGVTVKPRYFGAQRRRYTKPPVSQRQLADIPLYAVSDQLVRLAELRKRCVRRRYKGNLRYQAQQRLKELGQPARLLIEDARALERQILTWKPELLQAWQSLVTELLQMEADSVFGLVTEEAGAWLIRLRTHLAAREGKLA